MTATHGGTTHGASVSIPGGGRDDPDEGWRRRPNPGQGQGLGLPVAAADPNVDPCDIACDALPARSAGDLDPADEAWLQRHAAECGYCRRQLASYDRLCGVLDACCAPPHVSVCVPPSVALPKASPVRSVRRRARVSPVWWTTADSPVGPLRLAATERGLAHISFAASESEQAAAAELARRGFDARPADEAPPGAGDVLARARAELDEYFAGRRRDFDLPLDWSGVTPFTRDTLEATAAVPFGRLETYGSIAGRIGKPGASRAVGNALGANPLPVIVPCHRIVATGGGIGGYTGGLGIKQRLLAIEGVTIGL